MSALLRILAWVLAVALVALPPENEKYSQTDLPTMWPPASRMRVTSVASPSGT